MSSEKTKLRKSNSYVKKRQRIRKVKFLSAGLFYLLFLASALVEQGINSLLLGISALPMAVASVAAYVDFEHSIQKLDSLAFHLFEAKRKVILFRVRQDEKLKEEAISELVSAVICLKKLEVESRQRFLLKSCFVNDHITKTLKTLEEYVLPSLESERELRKIEEILGGLLQKILTGNFRKVEEAKEEAAENLEKQKMVYPIKSKIRMNLARKKFRFYFTFVLSLIALSLFIYSIMPGITAIILSGFVSLTIASVILKSEFR